MSIYRLRALRTLLALYKANADQRGHSSSVRSYLHTLYHMATQQPPASALLLHPPARSNSFSRSETSALPSRHTRVRYRKIGLDYIGKGNFAPEQRQDFKAIQCVKKKFDPLIKISREFQVKSKNLHISSFEGK